MLSVLVCRGLGVLDFRGFAQRFRFTRGGIRSVATVVLRV